MKRFLLTATVLVLLLPVLGGMIWGWLSIAEKTVWHLTATLLLALAIVAVVVYWEVIAFTQALPGWPIFWHMFRWNVLGLAVLGTAAFFITRPMVILGLVSLGLVLLLPKLNHAAGGPSWTYVLRDIRYWPIAALWVGVGILLPFKLIFWVPAVDGMRSQAASAFFRFGFAGLIFVLSLLLLIQALRRLRQREAHS